MQLGSRVLFKEFQGGGITMVGSFCVLPSRSKGSNTHKTNLKINSRSLRHTCFAATVDNVIICGNIQGNMYMG